ncbi:MULTISPECIES: DUF6384 family protein [unclassified Pseudomonas]|jgi:hypothetical protein|uniref:DUF6384 family protein n=1 Tax=unclassified Pseudomonas TaxID=196821 RepID=UPI00165D5E7B|nr:DUF6384 family protein [Pseudomonas sp. EZ-C24]
MSVSLSDQMAAMAIVDQLRHREMEIQEHLDLPQRRTDVAERIRTYYKNNGIRFNDAQIEQGVHQFFSSRLMFEAPPLSRKQRLLVRLIMARRLLLTWAFTLLLFGLLILGGNALMEQRENLSALNVSASQDYQQRLLTRLNATALPASDRQRIFRWSEKASENIAAGRLKAANSNLDSLKYYLDYAAQPLTIQIVDRPGVKSGVERCYEAAGCSSNSTRGKAWYLVVEPLDVAGKPALMEVTSIETGETRWSKLFAVRVGYDSYLKVREDKLDDGHISDLMMGIKPVNSLVPYFPKGTIPLQMILEW